MPCGCWSLQSSYPNRCIPEIAAAKPISRSPIFFPELRYAINAALRKRDKIIAALSTASTSGPSHQRL
jgi:hypothetical protein